MEEFNWIMPLLLLPGVGLLVQSTAIRYDRIHDELHALLDRGGQHENPIFLKHLGTRARWFRNALVALYVSACMFAIGSILGAIADVVLGESEIIVIIFAGSGICCLLYAAIHLVRESFLSLEVLEVHLSEIEMGEHRHG